jgi:hypothetical protein
LQLEQARRDCDGQALLPVRLLEQLT